MINELTGNHDLMDIRGQEALVEWFKLAHQTDPGAALYSNESQILSGNKVDAFEKHLRFLLDHGAPVGGIGFQGHTWVYELADV